MWYNAKDISYTVLIIYQSSRLSDLSVTSATKNENKVDRKYVIKSAIETTDL